MNAESATAETVTADTESPARIALWWIVETVFLAICGGVLVMYLPLPAAVSGLLVCGLIWFALAHMHLALDLETLVLEGGRGPDLYAQRRVLLIRLLAFYFGALTYGLGMVVWHVYQRPSEMHPDFVPTVVLMGAAVFRFLCLQRRYLRLRAEELALGA